MSRRPLAITAGDPAGVGPEVALRAVGQLNVEQTVVLYGDRDRLRRRAVQLGIDAQRLVDVDPGTVATLSRGAVGLVDAGRVSDDAVNLHASSMEAGYAQLRALELAVDAALGGHVCALVTAPVSKQAIVASGVPFIGHTEYLAQRARLADDAVTMLFLGPRLSVSLVTTHVAIADLPREVTSERVERASRHLAAALVARGRPTIMRLAVTGLNPHAGEHGLFGDDEARAIEPALKRLRAESNISCCNIEWVGPRPAESAFREAAAGRYDGVVAMFHDQATIASKLLDWGHAVNVTWGLPFVRTSVDHGVAYDAACHGHVEADGMIAAVNMALDLTRHVAE